jgi:hypothetical protein
MWTRLIPLGCLALLAAGASLVEGCAGCEDKSAPPPQQVAGQQKSRGATGLPRDFLKPLRASQRALLRHHPEMDAPAVDSGSTSTADGGGG